MVNVDKLKGKMVENRINVEELAKRLKMDRTTLYRKINSNGETFTIREANLIVKELGLSIEDASAIFFSQHVA